MRTGKDWKLRIVLSTPMNILTSCFPIVASGLELTSVLKTFSLVEKEPVFKTHSKQEGMTLTFYFGHFWSVWVLVTNCYIVLTNYTSITLYLKSW